MLYTSHYMEEGRNSLCTRVVSHGSGKALAAGTSDGFKAMIGRGETINVDLYRLNPDELAEIRRLPNEPTPFTLTTGCRCTMAVVPTTCWICLIILGSGISRLAGCSRNVRPSTMCSWRSPAGSQLGVPGDDGHRTTFFPPQHIPGTGDTW